MNDVESIFLAAREVPVERRAAFLADACGPDVALRSRVETMLRQAAAAAEFFGEDPASDVDTEGLRGAAPDFAPVGELVGAQIGRYRLLERIGEGGMGVVYMAEQKEPVQRRVALKILKLGMDTRQVVARFEAERQALAMMDHPNIAKILDAGATESGRPYFVMELVRGVPITEFCDLNKLSLRQRLDLFVPVCRAIQSAHQKGVIHRDLKPSNVLITLQPGEPTPKVIDFGVAKATSVRLTDKTVFTQHGTMIGTPAYMSPEQAEMSGLDVDTRTDVYSLGVLLYELLTGSTPFPQERLRSLALGQIQKVIAEEDPPKPSTRLSTLAGDRKSQIAVNRGLRPEKLGKEIPVDIDWIVMKCLEKDPRRRYDTVNGLALDLLRHLTNEPVLARPPSSAYRMQKAFRRNRIAFGAVAAVALALVLGVIASTRQAVRARRAEVQARGEAERAAKAERLAKERLELLTTERDAKVVALQDAEAISRFLTGVFQSPDPAQDGRTITVAEALDRATAKLDSELASQPERRVRLQAVLGETYHSLGLYREAVRLQEAVREYCIAKHGPESRQVLDASFSLASSYGALRRHAEALKLREDVLRLCRRMNSPADFQTLAAMHNLSTTLNAFRRFDESMKLSEEIVRICREANEPERPIALMALQNLASLKADAGNDEEALKLRENLLESTRKVHGAESPLGIDALNNVGVSYRKAGRTNDALRVQEQAAALSTKVRGPAHPGTLILLQNLARTYRDMGRQEAELGLLPRILEPSRKLNGPDHPDTLAALDRLVLLHALLGHKAEIAALRAEWESTERQAFLSHPKNTFKALAYAARLAWSGREAEYAEARRVILDNAAGFTDPGDLDRAAKAASLSPRSDAASLGAALRLARRSVELGAKHPYLPYFRLAQGLAEFRSGNHAEAEALLHAVAPDPASTGNLNITASAFRALALFQLGKKPEAAGILQAAERALGRPPPDRDDTVLYSASADDLICWMALKEARTTLHPADAPAR